MIKLHLTAAILTLCANAAFAQSIHTGSATGAYFNDICPQIQSSIKKEFFTKHQCVESAGTVDAIEKVTANPEDIGIGQKDVFLKSGSELMYANSGLYECMYGVTNSAEVADLESVSGRVPIALPSEKSGSATSFEIVKGLTPEMQDLENISHFETPMLAIESVISGENVVASFVQIADTSNELFKVINKNKLTFIPIANRDLLSAEVNGEALYQAMEVNVVPQGLFAKLSKEEAPTIHTACTEIVYFTGEAKDSDALLKQLNDVAAPTSDKWADILSSVKSVDKDSLLSLIGK